MADAQGVLGKLVLSWPARRRWRRYTREARRPLHALLLLIPLAAVYEALALWMRRGAGAAGDPLAESMLHGVLAWFGVAGFWVPAVTLVVSLLIWHRLRKDRWQPRWWVLGGMLGESVLLTVPLLVISGLFRQGARVADSGLAEELVSVLGGGVYEELVFRLLLISGLVWLLARHLRLRGTPGLSVAIGAASILFAICHFRPIGMDAFAWGSFWFRLAAGVYLSLVFVGRGLGVSAGCHVAYNVILVLWRSGGA